jgi:hypothetical protein
LFHRCAIVCGPLQPLHSRLYQLVAIKRRERYLAHRQYRQHVWQEQGLSFGRCRHFCNGKEENGRRREKSEVNDSYVADGLNQVGHASLLYDGRSVL